MLDQFPRVFKTHSHRPNLPRQEDMVEDRQDHWPLQVYMLARKPWWKDGEFVGDGRDGIWICQVSRRWMNSSKSHSHVLSKHPCFNYYHFFGEIYVIYVMSRFIVAYSWNVPAKGKEKWFLSKRHQHVHHITFSMFLQTPNPCFINMSCFLGI